MNISYAFFAFSLAVWSFAHFMMFTSTNSESALFWDYIANIGSILTPISLLIFILILTKVFSFLRKYLIVCIVSLGLFFIYLSLMPNFMTISVHKSWWGYDTIDGPLFSVIVLLNVILTSTAIILCFISNRKNLDKSFNKQIRLIGLGVLAPFIVGILTQIIPKILDYQMMPLTTFFSTITALIIAYNIVKNQLMIPLELSYRTKVTTSIVTLILLISLLTLIPGFVLAKSAAESDIHFQLEADAFSRSSHIESFLTEQKEDISGLISIIKTTNILSIKNGSIDMDNSPLVSTVFMDVVHDQEDVSNIEFLDINNKILFSTNQSCIGFQRDNILNQSNISEQVLIDQIHICNITNNPIISVSSNIVVENNTLGYLIFYLTLDELYKILLNPSTLGETVEYYLVDKQGYMISPSKFIDDAILRIKVNTINYYRASLHFQDDEELLSGHEEVFVFKDYRDTEVIGTHVTIDEMEWVLLAEQDVSEAFIPIYSLQRVLFFVFFAILIIGGIISVILSRIITNPIQVLISASKRIALGEFGATVEISTNDEIGLLADNFNSMSESIKRSNEKIEQYNKNLEELVNKRTNELQIKINELYIAKKEVSIKNEELLETKENLEELVKVRTKEISKILKLKDEFVSQLGHDLKNPLGPLLNLMPVLEKNVKDSKNKELIQVMYRNVLYMKNLVTKTLELARLNSPNTIFNFESIDLKDTINEIIAQNDYLFKSKNINVNNNLIDPVFIRADKLRIVELFNNLLNNAVKYSNENSNISINMIDQIDDYIISIKDEGIGMDADQINHVFDEFFKADSSRHDFDSSGLGMTISKRIVEKHGGRIWVESDGIGKGSTFHINLPRP